MKQLKNVLAGSFLALVLGSGCATTSEPRAASTVPETPQVAAVAPAQPAPVAAPAPPVPAAKSDLDMLQGKWTGKEIGSDSNGEATLVISGHNIEYHGSNPNDWYKG